MIEQTLFSMLADAGIKLKSYQPGSHQNSLICPKCGGGSHREHSLNVKIDDDGDGATWVCKRGTCGWKSGVRLKHDRPPRRKATPAKYKPLQWHSPWETEERPEWLYQFFADRHIGKQTVDRFGIYAREKWFFSGSRSERSAMVFPYRWNNIVHSRKYRAWPDKDYSQEAGLPTLFNADSLTDAEEVVWVEGETDVMALHECGYRNVVSLRDGADKEARYNPDDLRFAALSTHADELAQIKRFILAGDMDQPGLAQREELARRLGRHRVSLVTWPAGCKDACDTLRLEEGYYVVRDAIAGAKPYPWEGIHRVEQGTMSEIRNRGKPATMTTGTTTLDRVLKLPADGRLILITGIPNHGKSAWARFVMMHTAQHHGRKWLVFTPEHGFSDFIADCATVFTGKRFWPSSNLPAMNAEDDAAAEAFLADRVQVIQCDTETAPTVDWLLECAEFAVLRDGVSDVVFDPWNEIEHNRGDMSETDYTGRVLQRFRLFANARGCNVWVIAHPAKPPMLKAGEKRQPPGGYDVSGSANWANKFDLGLTVHSDQPGEVDIIVWKSRHASYWGMRGSTTRLDFDALCQRYRDPISTTDAEPTPYNAHWTED